MGRWKRILSDGDDIQIQAYYDRTNRQAANFAEIRNTFDIDFLQRLRLPARQEVSWGLGARVDPVNDHGGGFGSCSLFPINEPIILLTAFLQDEIGLVERTPRAHSRDKIAAHEFYPASIWNRARGCCGRPTTSKRFGRPLRMPCALLPTPRKISIFRDSSPQPRTELLSSRDSMPTLTLRAEQMNGYELGYRRLLGKKFYVDITGYYNHYHDLFSEELAGPIFLETTPAPAHLLLPAQFRNGLLGYTKGVEIAPEWRPTD